MTVKINVVDHYDLPLNSGFLRLINYDDSPIPHLEYGVTNGNRHQGIMSKALPKYLELCKKNGFDNLAAIVKEDNVPSIKLLEKNDFVYVKNYGDKKTYVWNANLKAKDMKELIVAALGLTSL